MNPVNSEVFAAGQQKARIGLSITRPVELLLERTTKDPRDLPTMTPMQSSLEIYQLFVPGLENKNSLFGTALKVISHDYA
jgi:hypothetical protein